MRLSVSAIFPEQGFQRKAVTTAVFVNDGMMTKGFLWPSLQKKVFPPTGFDEELEDDVEIDFRDALCDFLADGEILILQGNGYEGMRYITGWATAYDNTGKMVTINIDDIYAKAAKAFDVKETDINRATY